MIELILFFLKTYSIVVTLIGLYGFFVWWHDEDITLISIEDLTTTGLFIIVLYVTSIYAWTL